MSKTNFDLIKNNKSFVSYVKDNRDPEQIPFGSQTIEELLDNAKKELEGHFNDTYKFMSFIGEYGQFRFERNEKRSGDLIWFHCFPLEYPTQYWEDHNQNVIYIGGFRNAGCLTPLVNEPNEIESFYMMSDGSFYDQDKKKIADNAEEFFEYILTVEYDHHEPIQEITYQRLKNAGWYEGRKVDISALVKDCEQNGVFLTEAQKHFLEEFGGIKGVDKYSREFEISIIRKWDYYEPVDEDEWIGLDHRENMVRVGFCYDEMMTLWLSYDGLLFLDNPLQLGRTALEGFNVLLGDLKV